MPFSSYLALVLRRKALVREGSFIIIVIVHAALADDDAVGGEHDEGDPSSSLRCPSGQSLGVSAAPVVNLDVLDDVDAALLETLVEEDRSCLTRMTPSGARGGGSRRPR